MEDCGWSDRIHGEGEAPMADMQDTVMKVVASERFPVMKVVASERFPFGIPKGWYVVARSDELSPGDLKPLHYFGEELILFRGEDGAAGLIDAYCDHLGAHLAYGGKVVGGAVECPFHHWRWNGAGRCVAIPYATIIPPNARVRSYPVREHSGFLWGWYDTKGREPAFEVPPIAQYRNPDWSEEWINYEYSIRSHPQEVFENGIDYPHFAYVHGFEFPAGAEFRFDGQEYLWRHSTNRGTEVCEGGREDVRQEGRVTGLGASVLRITGELDVIIFFAPTPISGEEVHLRLSVIANLTHGSDVREKVGSYADSQARTLTEDFAIWEHKKYRKEPRLCHKDGPIAEFRRWAAQFYA
jgi:nitrite reductase/ring-hydroxylating ferredoxin subunit